MSNTKSESEKKSGFFKRNRKPIFIFLFVLLNIVVIATTAMAEFGNSKEAAKLTDVSIKWWLLIPAALCFILAINLDVHKYVLMIRKLSGNKENSNTGQIRKVARRTVMLGRYYDNVTPAAVGGQPFQIYYMRKNSGLPKGASTAVPIFGMISVQIGFLIIAIICFLFGSFAINNPVLMATAWFGLLFYAFWPVVVMGATFFPKATTKIIKALVKLLSKIRFVKEPKTTLKKVETEVTEYAKSVKLIIKTPGLLVRTILISIGYNFLIVSIPFFVLTAFGGDANFWLCFATTTAVMAAVYFVPTPGNTGAAEGTFFLVFSGLSTGYIFWAMLAWRFFSYYIYIIIGALIYLFMHLEKKRDKIT